MTKSAAFNWDLCAAHAIIRSMNGQVLDLRQLLIYFKENVSLTNCSLSQFEILYNQIVPTSPFQPTEYACVPFIAFFNPSDLPEILHFLLVNNIRID